MVVSKDEGLLTYHLARHGQGDHQPCLSVRAVLDNYVAAMLGDDLLREGNADPAIKCWFTVKGKEQLTFIERSRVEIPATDFDHYMAMVGGSGNGEFTTFLHTS